MGDKIGVESNVITTTDNWTGLEFRIWIPINNFNQIAFEESINNELAGVNFRSIPRREINQQPQILGASTNNRTNTNEQEVHSNGQDRQHIQGANRPNGDYRSPRNDKKLSIPEDQRVSYQEVEPVIKSDIADAVNLAPKTQGHFDSIPQGPLNQLQLQEIVDPGREGPSYSGQLMRRETAEIVGDPVSNKGPQKQNMVADRVNENEPLQESRKPPKKYIVKGKARVQQNDDVSIRINDLADTMRENLKTLQPISDCVCIYRVPDQLQGINDEAYLPQIVSIGPFYHGDKKLALMENKKKRYLQSFLLSNVSMEELFKETLEMEPRLRNSYAEDIVFENSDDFVTLMLVDGVFILEYFLRRRLRDWEPNDPIFNKQRMTNTIRFDLLLLENQIPFFLLDHLFRLSKKPEIRSLSPIKLVHRFLVESTGWNWLANVKDSNNEDQETNPHHILDFLSTLLLPREPRQGQELKIRGSPSIMELHSAGVKFKSVPDRHFLDIQFNNGVLEIPTWKINDRTELLFRNLLAYEQCNPPHHYLSDYIAFMDMLIDVDQDVELLVWNGIIENLLQDNQSVAELVNSLSKNNVIYDKDFYFSGLVEELKSYYERPWHKWKANLNQEYFKNPWTIISVIAAVFLLLLTILQSVCSVLQVL